MNQTPPRRRVVVGVDASDSAARAATWAAAEAADRGASLHVVHAIETNPSEVVMSPVPFEDYKRRVRTDSGKLLARTVDLVHTGHPGLTVTTETATDDPVRALLNAGQDADLVVVGTRGLGGFAGLLLGSVGLGLVSQSHRPVAIVRDDADRKWEIVLGVEEDEPIGAVEYAFAAAARTGTVLRLVHAWTVPPAYSGYHEADPGAVEKDRARGVEQLVSPVRDRFPGVDAEVSTVRGNPARVLVEASRDARLLVVAAHRRRGALGSGIGTVIHALIHHAHAPVVVVPTA